MKKFIKNDFKIISTLVFSVFLTNVYSQTSSKMTKLDCGIHKNYVSIDFFQNIRPQAKGSVKLEIVGSNLIVTLPSYPKKCLNGEKYTLKDNKPTTYNKNDPEFQKIAKEINAEVDAKTGDFYLTEEYVKKHAKDQNFSSIELGDTEPGLKHKFDLIKNINSTPTRYMISSYTRTRLAKSEAVAPILEPGFFSFEKEKSHVLRFKLSDGGWKNYQDCLAATKDDTDSDDKFFPESRYNLSLNSSGKIYFAESNQPDNPRTSTLSKTNIPSNKEFLNCYNVYSLKQDGSEEDLVYKTDADKSSEKITDDVRKNIEAYEEICQRGDTKELKNIVEEIKDIPELKKIRVIMQKVIADSVKSDLKEEVKAIKGKGKIVFEDGDDSALKKNLEEYNKYVQQPIIDQIEELYESLKTEKDKDNRKKILAELKKLKTQLLDDSKNLVDEGVVKRLEDSGYFATAEIAMQVREASRFFGGDPKRGGQNYNFAKNKSDYEKLVKNYQAASIIKQKVFLAKSGELTGESEKFKRYAVMERNKMPKIQQAFQMWQDSALKELQKVCYPTFYTPYTQSNCNKKGEEFKRIYAEKLKEFQGRMAQTEERAAKFENYAKDFTKYEAEGKRKVATETPVDEFGDVVGGLDIDEYGLKQYLNPGSESNSNGQYTSEYDPAFSNPSHGLQSNYNGMNPSAQQAPYPVSMPNYMQQGQNPYAQQQFAYNYNQQPMYQQQYPAPMNYYQQQPQYQYYRQQYPGGYQQMVPYNTFR